MIFNVITAAFLAQLALAGSTIDDCGNAHIKCYSGSLQAHGVCNPDRQGDFKCAEACNDGFLYNPNSLTCVQSSVDACGPTYNKQKCTTPFANSFATCIPDDRSFKCSASCKNGYLWNPNSFTCSQQSLQSCGVEGGAKSACTTPFQNSYALCKPKDKTSFDCGAACNYGFIWNPTKFTCDAAPQNLDNSCGSNFADCTTISIGGNGKYTCQAGPNGGTLAGKNSCQATCNNGFVFDNNVSVFKCVTPVTTCLNAANVNTDCTKLSSPNGYYVCTPGGSPNSPTGNCKLNCNNFYRSNLSDANNPTCTAV